LIHKKPTAEQARRIYGGPAAAERPERIKPLLLSETELAPLIGMSLSFLRRDRRTARLIPFIKLGDRVLYDMDRVKEALRTLEVGGAKPQPRGRKSA